MSPAVGSDGALYFGAKGKGGSGGVFYAIEPNGAKRWEYPVSGVIRSSATIGGNGTIYVGAGSEVIALRPNGTLLWSHDLGRPITDLASELQYPELAEDARGVLRTLTSCEKPIAAKDNRWFTVRIMPYRTLDNRIDGVVIGEHDASQVLVFSSLRRDGKPIDIDSEFKQKIYNFYVLSGRKAA